MNFLSPNGDVSLREQISVYMHTHMERVHVWLTSKNPVIQITFVITTQIHTDNELTENDKDMGKKG